ncbi:MAG: DUF2797 domain-containing protein [Gammaproteobacteria bacterium]|nr:DUF2797 domain-containing protein [Gammaproteobacteria bacterium]
MKHGHLAKMQSKLSSPVHYHLPLGDQTIDLKPLIGQSLKLQHNEGLINCTACGRKTKKSYSQGHCYPCMKRLARCDLCIVKPERCHYAQGSCREPQWGESFCLQDHIVYLANSSGLKIGITRQTQIPTRWIDQGASQALPIMRVTQRLHSGLVEVLFKEHIADKTDWRKMLKNERPEVNLIQRRDELLNLLAAPLQQLRDVLHDPITILDEAKLVDINYPVLEYPTKIKAHNFDKTPTVEGTLMGIKGQYLIFDTGVLNIRKFSGYHVTLSQSPTLL